MSNEVKRDSKGRWLPGRSPNPKGRPPGNEVIRKRLESFSEHLIDKTVELALEGNVQALKICMDRLCPPVKDESKFVQIKGMDEADNLSSKSRLIFQSLSKGDISIEDSLKLLNALSVVGRIFESTELEKRVQDLEDQNI